MIILVIQVTNTVCRIYHIFKAQNPYLSQKNHLARFEITEAKSKVDMFKRFWKLWTLMDYVFVLVLIESAAYMLRFMVWVVLSSLYQVYECLGSTYRILRILYGEYRIGDLTSALGKTCKVFSSWEL